MDGIGRGENGGPCGHALLGQAEVHVVRGEQAKTAVMVCDVVPGEEDVAVGADIWIEPNRAGKSGRYLKVLNWASENRVVVGDMRPAVGLRHAEVGE